MTNPAISQPLSTDAERLPDCFSLFAEPSSWQSGTKCAIARCVKTDSISRRNGLGVHAVLRDIRGGFLTHSRCADGTGRIIATDRMGNQVILQFTPVGSTEKQDWIHLVEDGERTLMRVAASGGAVIETYHEDGAFEFLAQDETGRSIFLRFARRLHRT